MKKTWLLAPMAAVLLLAACGGAEKETKKESTDVSADAKEQTANPKVDSKEVEKETTKSELGKLTVVYKNKELKKSVKNGPVNLDVNAIQIATLEPSEAYKDSFDGKEKVTIATVEMAVENTVDDTTHFYPDQATLTTDTGEQVEARLILSDNIGGDFLGKIKKDGNVIFVLKSEPEKIGKVTLHIDGASDESYVSVGKDIKMEIPIK
ncbi:hypothetical protein JFL43_10870 [Viridibacillus sp. YIM B01967]|uniref:Lipoprotein n=1 Tax=Viridibacillus soli TaxID=2798301 RepID=A0ABS1H8B2_9BACL|nr:hypothetical protein [Viridibacillus soli]MBK3495342.1 hypothetical protein [Viridibacillus soli]